MSEMTNYDEVMVDENELMESGEGRDLSTLIGVGLIAGGGVVAYEGGKRIVKFVKSKVGPFAKKHLPIGKKDADSSEPEKSGQDESAKVDAK